MCLVCLYMLCVVLQAICTVYQDMVTAETKVVELCYECICLAEQIARLSEIQGHMTQRTPNLTNKDKRFHGVSPLFILFRFWQFNFMLTRKTKVHARENLI